MYDLIIVGGGPAGMSAALYAARQNLKFLMLAETVGGLLNFVPSLKTYLGFHYVSGYDLVKTFKKQLNEYNVSIREEKVIRIRKIRGGFETETTSTRYRSRTVLIASGRRFKRLNIPGEESYRNHGLSDCAVCDGPMFKGKTVAIIGGGRTGIYATLFLLKIAKKIYLIEKESRLKTTEGLGHYVEMLKGQKHVKLLLETRPKAVRGNAFVRDLVLTRKGKETVLPVDGVFVEIGYEPNSACVENVAKLNVRGEIIVDGECKTNIPGLFAAGDVTHLKEKQVVVSVGDGAKAVLAAIMYLERLKKA